MVARIWMFHSMMDQEPATMKDVAEIAGLSVMSVSRVLSGNRPVSAETEARVRAAVELSSFRLNRSARNLRQGRRLTTIGMIFERLDDPYYSRLVGASQVVATTNSSMLMVASPTPGVDQASLVRAFVQRGIDGLLIQPSSTDWEKEVVGGPPVVLFSRTLGAENFDAVVVDSFEGAYLATSHLISLGHRRIAVVDYGSSDPVGWTERFIDTRADRRRGYQEALRDAGIPEYPELIVLAGPTVKGASLAAQKIALSSNPPTAFFAMNNRMTVGVIAALGVRIDGFGLVGIDDFELADALVPQVTVVTQDPESLGTIGAELLFARIQSPNSPLIRIERPMKLIVRESGVGWRL